MKETLLKKEFNNKNLTRIRNLIQNKNNDKISDTYGYEEYKKDHSEGDIWEEGGRTWTIKDGIKMNIRKVKESIFPVLCPKCSKPMNHKFDKQMMGIHGMCFNCVIEFETRLKMEGKYEEYERSMIMNNIKYTSDTLLDGYKDFIKDLNNSNYLDEDGTKQAWEGKGINEDKVEEVVDVIKEKLNNISET